MARCTIERKAAVRRRSLKSRGFATIDNEGAIAGRAVVGEINTEWCLVRIVEREDGRFLSLEAHEGIVAGGVAMVPGVCAATTVEQVDALIAAIEQMKGLLS